MGRAYPGYSRAGIHHGAHRLYSFLPQHAVLVTAVSSTSSCSAAEVALVSAGHRSVSCIRHTLPTWGMLAGLRWLAGQERSAVATLTAAW